MLLMVRHCRLLGSWPLVCLSVYSRIAHPLLVCCSSASSSVCSCISHPSVRASLIRLIVRLIVRRSSVTDLSARPYLLVHWLCIARMPVPLPLVCLLVAAPSLVCR